MMIDAIEAGDAARLFAPNLLFDLLAVESQGSGGIAYISSAICSSMDFSDTVESPISV